MTRQPGGRWEKRAGECAVYPRSDGRLAVIAGGEVFGVEVGVVRELEHLGDDVGIRGTVCEADHRHRTVPEPHMGAEQRIGDAEDGGEKRHAESLVRKERDTLFVRGNGGIGAGGGIETVTETFKKRIGVRADARCAVPARMRAEIVVPIPVVTECGNLRGDQQFPRFGILIDPAAVPLRIRNGKFTPGKVFTAPVKHRRCEV